MHRVYDKDRKLNIDFIFWHSMTRKSTFLRKRTASRVWWKPVVEGKWKIISENCSWNE